MNAHVNEKAILDLKSESPHRMTSQHCDRKLDCAIIGAGISGLNTALELCGNENVRSITIYEKSDQIGGVLSHRTRNGYHLECAAQGVLSSRDSFTQLTRRIGLENQALWGSPKLRRYLIKDDQLIAVSGNFFRWVTSGLITFGGLIRFFAEAFQKRQVSGFNDSLYAFFARRFGHRFATRFVIPMATGIWAGGSRILIARHVFPALVELEMKHGSVIRGAIVLGLKKLFKRAESNKAPINSLQKDSAKKTKPKGLVTFKGGMTQWVQAIETELQKTAKEKGIELKIRLATPVQSVRCLEPNLILEKTSQTSKCNEEKSFHALFSTVPLWREDLHFECNSFCQSRFDILRQTASHGLVVVGLGGKDTLPAAQGFGALAPDESKELLGIIFVHSTVPEHAPHGHFLYRLMLGGDRNPELIHLTDIDILSRAKDELSRLGLVSKAVTYEFEEVVRWPHVIPLQDSHQDNRLQAMREIETALPGLYFSGNYISGVGVHDCLVTSKIKAEKLNEDFQKGRIMQSFALILSAFIFMFFSSTSLNSGQTSAWKPFAFTEKALADTESKQDPATQTGNSPRFVIQRIVALTENDGAEQLAEYLEFPKQNQRTRKTENQDPTSPVRIELARKFSEVFNRSADVSLGRVSDKPEGNLDDLPDPNLENVGMIRIQGTKIPLILARVQTAESQQSWKVSEATVKEVLKNYSSTYEPPFIESLPKELYSEQWGGLFIWQWFALFFMLLLSLGAGVLTSFLIKKAMFKLVHGENEEFRRSFRRTSLPISFFIVSLFVGASIPYLDLTFEVRRSLFTALRILQIISIAAVLMRLGQAAAVSYESYLRKNQRENQIALVPPLRKAFKAIVFLVACLLLFRSLGFDVSAVVAGLGVGGLAIALAGQKTVENLFGGISVVVDQPIRVGDFGRYGSLVGTVEDIGLRSTRIRTLDRTVVTIPNAEFSQIQIENYAKRDRIRFVRVMGVRYETTPGQMKTLLHKLRLMLKNDDRIDPDPRRVRFINLGNSALEIEIFCYIKTRDYSEYLAIIEELNLNILEIVAACGTECAFNSQASYHFQLSALPAEKVKNAEDFALENSL